MTESLNDITTREDVVRMVDAFYGRVNEDGLLSPIFNDFAGVNWEHHLPQMYDFWANILLGDMSYRGRPFPKHIPLPISKPHFERWLQLFKETVDAHFVGSKANEAKQRAQSIATIFEHKLSIIRNFQ